MWFLLFPLGSYLGDDWPSMSTKNGISPAIFGSWNSENSQKKLTWNRFTSNLWKGKSFFHQTLHDLEIHVIFWGCFMIIRWKSHTFPGDLGHTKRHKPLSTHENGVHGVHVHRGEAKEWQFLWLQWLCRWSELELWHLRCFGWRWWRRGNWCRLRVRVPGREEMRKTKDPCCVFFCLRSFCWTGRFEHIITCWNTILLNFVAVKDFYQAIYLFQWFAKTLTGLAFC